MVKLKKGLLVITLVSLIMLSIRPFSIYADATDGEFDNDSVVGVQVEEYEELLSGVQGTRYRFNIILDGFYVGDFQIHVEYDSYNVSTSNWDHFTINRTVYVCGYDTYFETWMRENWLPPSSISWSASVNNSDQCIFVGRMESQQLLNLLIALRSSYINNSSVEIGYLNQIDQKIDYLKSLRQYSFPYESLKSNLFLMSKGYPYELLNYATFDYPLYSISTNNQLSYFWVDSNKKLYMIFAIDKNINSANQIQGSSLTDYLAFSGAFSSFESFDILGNFYLGSPGAYYTFIKVVLNSSGGNIVVTAKQDFKFISIYNDLSIYTKNISTDFALRFGLTNQLLDDLHIIANGTSQSNNSASSLESSTSSFSSTASDVYNVEDQVSSGFSSSMQNIPSSFNFQNNFGSSFVVSASWVRDQFNNMTANNPFGSLITFSLILGVALLIIGRLLS